MQYSTNLNMNKPEKADQYNIDHWNQNTDILDSAIQHEIDRATTAENETNSNLSSHVNNTNNPHEVTKTQIGLSEVENTKLSTWEGSSNLTTCSKGTFGDAITKNIANDITDSDSDLPMASLIHKNIQKFTYIVNSNASLEYWLTNGSSGTSSGGNDFTSVLIKKGNWSFSGTAVALDSRTKVIVGEVGNKINANGNALIFYNYSNNPPSTFEFQTDEYYIFNVHVTNGNSPFNKCYNLYNCSSSNNSSGDNFINCGNLINCRVYNPKNYGFRSCTNLINCSVSFDADVTLNDGAFNNCVGLTNCNLIPKNANVSIKGSGFYLCYDLTNCKIKALTTKYTFSGFQSCWCLSNCENESIKSTTAGVTLNGFFNCSILTNCRCLGATSTGSSGYGYGFSSCKGVLNCYVSSATTAKYDSSYSVRGSTSSTYACAGTPNGGFNT